MDKIVIKYGGSVQKGGSAADGFLDELASLAHTGGSWAVVHGGGAEISEWLKRVGHTSEFKNGQRVTDDLTLAVVEMVLCGRVGKRIARHLAACGVRAASVSGEDDRMLVARPLDRGEYGHVGEIETVNTGLLTALWEQGYVPVVAPLGVGADGRVYNINADVAAGQIAGALGADLLVLATDVTGVKESADSATVIPELTVAEAMAMIRTGCAVGGMIPKLTSAAVAIAGGVRTVVIASGEEPGLLARVMQGQSAGTRIVGNREGSVHHA